MNNFKKTKLITSLTSLGALTVTAPVVSTAFTTDKTTKSTTKSLNSATPNYKQIAVADIKWNKQTVYTTNNTTEIANKVKQDNNSVFSLYPALDSSVTISAVYTQATKLITVKVQANSGQNRYTGSTSWEADYVEPTPTPEPFPTGITKITYTNLKAKLGFLHPGAKYQITDYNLTVNNGSGAPYQNKAQSTNHYFDIIVTALTTSTFDENAKAVRHEGDTYFANNNLEAWEIKYSFANDTSKYDWALDTTAGRGVIYYMKDEFGNEAPYDFKNMGMYFANSVVSGWRYTFDYNNAQDASLKGNVFNNVIKPYIKQSETNANSFVRTLNFITLLTKKDQPLTYQMYNNTFDTNCNNICTLGSLNDNIFGRDSSDIQIWVRSTNVYHHNTFDGMCAHIQIGASTDYASNITYFENNTFIKCVGTATNKLIFNVSPMNGETVNPPQENTLSGAISINVSGTAPITEQYTASVSNVKSWAVVTKGTTTKPSWASIDATGKLTITPTSVPTSGASEITVYYTTTYCSYQVQLDVQVVPGGLNKLVLADTNAEITLEDKINPNNYCTSSGKINYTDSSGITSSVNASNVVEIKFVSVDPTVKTIGNNFLYGCSNLTTYSLAGLTNITSIGQNFLTGNSKLTNLQLDGLTNLKTIGNNAFCNCYTLETSDFSGAPNLEQIGQSSFNSLGNNTDPTSFTLNLSGATNLVYFGRQSFQNFYGNIDMRGNTKLQKFTGTGGGGLFSNCQNIQNFYLPRTESPIDADDATYSWQGLSTTIPLRFKCISEQQIYNYTHHGAWPDTRYTALYELDEE